MNVTTPLATVTIRVDPGSILTANRRLHWTQRSARTKTVRTTAGFEARAQRMPRGLGRARVVARVDYPDRRARDAHNLMPTLKAAVDGLIDAGLLPDDNDAYLDGPDPRATGKVTPGVFTIHLDIYGPDVPEASLRAAVTDWLRVGIAAGAGPEDLRRFMDWVASGA